MDFTEVFYPFLPICILTFLVLMVGISISYFTLRRLYQRMWTCPQCGAKDTAEIIDTQEIVLSNKVDYSLRKPARIKEKKFTDLYQCQVCQHTWRRSFTQKERLRVDHTS